MKDVPLKKQTGQLTPLNDAPVTQSFMKANITDQKCLLPVS
jgi:hypothetical protein